MDQLKFIHNVPEEMQKCDQWCVAVPGDKAPKLAGINGLRNASVVNDVWLSFDDAVTLARKHKGSVGFVITEQDPYICIDLDIKDSESFDALGEPYPISQWTTQDAFDRYQRILDSYDSYAEVSTSGKGMHIWIKGLMTSGCRRDGVEVYPRDRFIICTGKTISKAEYIVENNVIYISPIDKSSKPVRKRQKLLDILISEITKFSKDHKEPDKLEEISPTHSDDEVFQTGATAENAEKFIDLCNGNWKKYKYPSQSEADYALLSMLCFYSKSNIQVRRMFRATSLGNRQKATINDVYINRSIQYIRQAFADDVTVEINLDRQAKELKQLHDKGSLNASTSKILTPLREFEESSKNGIDWPPGKTGELARFIYRSSPRPIKEVAIVAAMGFLAGILGKSYTIPQSGLNLYIVLVARSAVGKEAMLSGVSLLLANLRNSIPGIDDFINFDSAVSGPALIKMCSDTPSFVNVNGEWGRTLKRLADETRHDPSMDGLRTVMTNLYQKSGPGSIVGGLGYSSKENNVKSMGAVAYSMIGDTTPGTFYNAINLSTMEDGFMSRFTVIEYDGLRPELNENPVTKLDKKLSTYICEMVNHSIDLLGHNTHQEVGFDTVVRELANGFNRECDAQINSTDDESYRQMWNRSHLKLLRWCALQASFENHITPVVNMEQYEWALDVIKRDINTMDTRLKEGDIGAGDRSREKKLMSILKEYMQNGCSNGYGIPISMQQDGVINRRYIQMRISKLRAFSEHRMGSSFAVTHSIKSMEDCGVLSELDRLSVKNKYGPSLGKCYRITWLP